VLLVVVAGYHQSPAFGVLAIVQWAVHQVRGMSQHSDRIPDFSAWPQGIQAASHSHRSVSALCVLSYRERGERTTGAFADRLKQMPLAMPQMCCALYLQAAGHLRQARCAARQHLNGLFESVLRQREYSLSRSARCCA